LRPNRPAAGAEDDRFAVGDHASRRQRARRRDELGRERRDVVEPARIQPHVIAVFVDLDAKPVELELERGLAAQARKGSFGIVGGLREHRHHRPEQREPEATDFGGTAVERGRRDLAEIAGEHVRAAHDLGVEVGRLRDRLDDHAVERAVAHLADE
jgi:hypothetical protein